MPRTVDEILEQADILAARFEDYDPSQNDEFGAEALEALRAAVSEQASAQRHLVEAVRRAREAKMSWDSIGSLVGTTGEAARQRYSKQVA
ncbi:MAG: hypothetical protein SPK50_04290 [Mobiluncus porci]|uniref:hypothetical protein n=1 Tax=Mobiluncus TaxID=2050 RepID=UPI0023F17C8F|nr:MULTISPECIES: hypothetical protein [Mobiluncus]MCI6583718.1 hypothetical protein [Mobiluncus sp.]MDD7540774.1 hypothetical protein [Mobiluncus porci]MDY5748336.1 hypothetical protein [Mobiluncus porci]